MNLDVEEKKREHDCNLRNQCCVLSSFSCTKSWCFVSDRSVNLSHEQKSSTEQLLESDFSLCLCDWIMKWEKKKTKSHNEMKTSKDVKNKIDERSKERDERWEMSAMKHWSSI